MKGPYIIVNSDGHICDYGYSPFNTNEEGREYTLSTAKIIKKILDDIKKK